MAPIDTDGHSARTMKVSMVPVPAFQCLDRFLLKRLLQRNRPGIRQACSQSAAFKANLAN